MKNIQKPQLSNFLQTLICETMDCTSLTELKCFYHEAAKWSLLNAFATLISKKHIVNLLEVFQDKLTRPSLETTTPLVSNYWACHPPKIKIKNPQTPLSEFNPVKKINSYIFLTFSQVVAVTDPVWIITQRHWCVKSNVKSNMSRYKKKRQGFSEIKMGRGSTSLQNCGLWIMFLNVQLQRLITYHQKTLEKFLCARYKAGNQHRMAVVFVH